MALNEYDFNYEAIRNPEPDDRGSLWTVIVSYEEAVLDDDGRYLGMETVVHDRFTCEDGPGFIAELRYCAEVPLEERWAADAAREDLERRGIRA